MDNYEISTKTIAIVPVSKNLTRIIEDDEDFYINKSPFQIIDHSCRYFGSSYEGRHVGTLSLIGISYKTPIIVEETQSIIFFPTITAKSNSCCWISLNKIKNYVKNDRTSKLIFKNGCELDLDISLGSLQNQIFRSTLLESTVRKRAKIS